MTHANVGSLLVFDPSKMAVAKDKAGHSVNASKDAVVGIITERGEGWLGLQGWLPCRSCLPMLAVRRAVQLSLGGWLGAAPSSAGGRASACSRSGPGALPARSSPALRTSPFSSFFSSPLQSADYMTKVVVKGKQSTSTKVSP